MTYLMTYLDFEIEIGPHTGDGHPLRVRAPGVGESGVTAPFPFSAAELETELLRLENAILHVGHMRRTNLTPHELAIQSFGQKLFDFLLTGEAGQLYRECQREALHRGAGVRLKLHVEPPELTGVPWELLFDRRRGDYVCLDPHTPLVRYLNLAQRIAPLVVEPPLRILAMIASPEDRVALEVEREQQRLARALEPLQAQGLVELHWLEGGNWRDLQRMMRPNYGPWHIFHFIGHGGYDPQRDEGLLLFCDDKNNAQRISATQLSRLLARQRGSLRLALLNACEGARGGSTDLFSSTAATLVRGGIPAVLAMQYAITDGAALEFSRTFYEALADGLAVDTAVSDARNAINYHNAASLEWGTPVLHMRAVDGNIFAVGDLRPVPPVRAEPPPVDEPAVEAAEEPAPTPRPAQSQADKAVDPGSSVPLRNALAALYGGRISARRVVADAGLDSSRIDFSGVAINAWHAILSEAAKSNRIEALIAVALAEYPKNSDLLAAVATYRRTRSVEVPTVDVETEPVRSAVPDTPIEFDWVTIPAGPFLMGSDKGRDPRAHDDELPQHTVVLSEFHITRTPVTNAQYKVFVEATGYKQPSHWEKGTIPQGKEIHPVVYVSWKDAQAFCQWAGVRLPSEAEWEKAARGTAGLIYPWGDEDPDEERCNFGGNVGNTKAVGSYPVGTNQILDMAGNVREWTSSLWGEDKDKPTFCYPYNSSDGREDSQAAGLRVARGGSFRFDEEFVRCAYRSWGNQDLKREDVGFRVSSPSL